MLRALSVGLAALALLMAAIAASALWFARAKPQPAGDVIVVLGAGKDAAGNLSATARARVATGVSLYQAGAAPAILFTGGPEEAGFDPHAARMGRMAEDLGVPRSAILVEGRAQSTLQNALLSRPLIAGRRAVLVTHGYHMARSRLSFAWAGVRVSGHATPGALPTGAVPAFWAVAREALATPFNLGRVAAWHALGWVGWDEAARLPLLTRHERARNGRG